MFGLIPKEENFFKMFKSSSENLIIGAELLKDMLDNYSNPLQSQQKIKEIEHKGDNITHEIIRKLNKSFITPFDREDIYSLASALDDVLDSIDGCAKHMVMYNIENITPEAKELGFISLRACLVLDKAISKLGNKLEHISEFCVEINSLENEADRVRSESISRLFVEEKNPILLIKWKDIYENLELVSDKCEDAANILESIVVKNA